MDPSPHAGSEGFTGIECPDTITLSEFRTVDPVHAVPWVSGSLQLGPVGEVTRCRAVDGAR
jgi:hypothetical protein